MRIVHIVTLVSPDAAFGGPMRVAVNQCRALLDRGHDVTLVAAMRGYDEPPHQIGGVPVMLFPGRRAVPGIGFAGLDSTEMRQWLRTNLRYYDVAHIHLARDLVTLPAVRAARRAKTPYVIQTHGTLAEPSNPLVKGVDTLTTNKYLRGAKAVFVHDSVEAATVRELTAKAPVRVLPGGVPFSDDVADPASRDVLFLARLAPQKRALVFLEAATSLRTEFPDWTFSIVGPDAGEADAVAAANDAGVARIEGPLPIDQTARRMRRSAVYVLPSLAEPFAMAVVEAMAVAVPVIVHDDSGLAPDVIKADAGLVFRGGADELAVAMRILMDDPDLRARMGAQGRDHVRQHFAMDRITLELEGAYRDAIG